MNHIFIVSSTLKDAHGIFMILHDIMSNKIRMEDVEIEFIQPISEDGELDCYDFGDECAQFRTALPDGNCVRLIHRPIPVRSFSGGSRAWAEEAVRIIMECDGPTCILLDLGTVCQNRNTTVLYQALCDVGMNQNCIPYTPDPDSSDCEIWRKKNGCTDLIVKRMNVTRARAIYIPMMQRIHEILNI